MQKQSLCFASDPLVFAGHKYLINAFTLCIYSYTISISVVLFQSAYHVNMLIGGFDKDKGPELYFMDYLASIMDLPFAVHGYSSFFSLSVLDRYYRPGELTTTEIILLGLNCHFSICIKLQFSFVYDSILESFSL